MPTYAGFYPYEGTFKTRQTTVVASQAFSVGDALKLSNPGTADEMTIAASNDTIKGVFNGVPVASTDSDYASIKTRTYWNVILGEEQLWYANVEAGTADQTTDVGYEADLNSADGITLNASTNDDFVVTKVLNSTTVIGYFK